MSYIGLYSILLTGKTVKRLLQIYHFFSKRGLIIFQNRNSITKFNNFSSNYRPDKELTLIVTEPTIMLDSKFQQFYHKHVSGSETLDVVSTVYVEECLTSACKPDKSNFEVTFVKLYHIHKARVH